MIQVEEKHENQAENAPVAATEPIAEMDEKHPLQNKYVCYQTNE